MKVNDFVKAAYDTFFGGFAIGLKVNVMRFTMNVSLVIFEMKDVVVTTRTEAFGVKRHFPFTTLATLDLWLPFQLLVASVTQSFGMMLFLFIAVDTDFRGHTKKNPFAYKKLC